MTERTCTIDGCDKTTTARGWCKPHYMRWRRYGDPLGVAPLRPQIVADDCAVEGCDRPRASKTNGTRRALCGGHQNRKDRFGDVMADKPLRKVTLNAGGHLSSHGYWLKAMPGHPLAFANGNVLEHRAIVYDLHGAGEHPCHWCSRIVDWSIEFPAPGALVVDHLDGNRINNDPSNLVISCQPCNTARAKAGNSIDWTLAKT